MADKSMTEKPVKFINTQRVHALLDCYGADATRWPEDERAAAIAMIHNKPDLQEKLLDAQVLDMALGIPHDTTVSSPSVEQSIVDNIINHLPEQFPASEKDSHLNKKDLKTKNPWFQFGLAATITLVAVSSVLFGNHHSEQQQQIDTVNNRAAIIQSPANSKIVAKGTQSELDQWLWQEISGENTPDDSDDGLTMMNLIEFES